MGATLQNFYLRNYSHLAVIKGIFKFHVHIYSHNYKYIIRDSVKVSGRPQAATVLPETMKNIFLNGPFSASFSFIFVFSTNS